MSARRPAIDVAPSDLVNAVQLSTEGSFDVAVLSSHYAVHDTHRARHSGPNALAATHLNREDSEMRHSTHFRSVPAGRVLAVSIAAIAVSIAAILAAACSESPTAPVAPASRALDVAGGASCACLTTSLRSRRR